MSAIPTSRNRRTARIAALLLLCQALAGTVVPLVHAQEPERAPAAFEAHHDGSCLVLHDAMRCVLCQYAGSLAAPLSAPDAAPGALTYARHTRIDHQWGPAERSDGASRPRAPPLSLS